jgi:hypothetical protein
MKDIISHKIHRNTIFYQQMPRDNTVFKAIGFPSLDGQSQLCTMAYGWTHDVDEWLVVT